MKKINYNQIGKFVTSKERTTLYDTASINVQPGIWLRVAEASNRHTTTGIVTVVCHWVDNPPHIFTFIPAITSQNVIINILSNSFYSTDKVISKIRIVVDSTNNKAYIDILNRLKVQEISVQISNSHLLKPLSPHVVSSDQSGIVTEFNL